MDQLKGVNLGNWLVLEKWMTEELFSGTTAMDETYLCKQLGRERAMERLKVHRDEFITERDFEEIAVKGFNAVRIPVPFFLFEDVGPYIHCYEYLDKAFDWAEQHGLQVLIDLHTAPGGHNGTDNSGICGIRTWSTRRSYIDYTVGVLEKIAQRYGQRTALWGIGVLNEPMCCDTPNGAMMNIENFVSFYVPVDQELAAQNANYTLGFLRDFYREAYGAIRRHTDKYVVFSDAFELDIWDDFLREFDQVVLDTHHYLMTPDMTLFTERNAQVYSAWLAALGKRLSAAARRVPLIVGEWNIQNQADNLAGMSREEKDRLYNTVADGFLQGMTDCLGWFYWSWKVNMTGQDAVCDSASRCVDHGWLRI